MRNKILVLLIALVSFAANKMYAAYSITVNGNSPTAYVCAGTAAGGVNIQVYNGNTNVTNSVYVFASSAGSITPTGTGNLVHGPGYLVANGAGANWGNVTLKVFLTNNPAPGTDVASMTVVVIPTGTIISGALTVPSGLYNPGVGSSATFSLNTSMQFVSTNALTWSLTNIGNASCYWTGSGSGANYTITPLPYAPLFTPSAQLSASFLPPANAPYCSANSDNTNTFGRTPVITSSLNGILCNNAFATLTCNVSDNPWYPTTYGTTGYLAIQHARDVHLTVDWYKTGTGLVGNGSTYTVTSPGTYYAIATQYPLNATRTAYLTTATGTKQSNSITISGPTAGTLTPSATINGITPSSGMSASTPKFNACGNNNLLFSGTGGTGVQNHTVQIISGTTGAVLTTVAQAVGSTLPTNLNIVSYFNNAQTGYYGIKVTVSNGCTNAVYIGYIFVNNTAPAQGTVTTVTNYTNNTTQYYAANAGNTWQSPIAVGRTSTVFQVGASVNNIGNPLVCNYQVKLYKVLGNGTLSAVLNTIPVTTFANCLSNSFIPAVSIASLGYYVNDGNVHPYYFTEMVNNNFYVPNGTEFYAEFILSNGCGSTSTGKYFTISPTFFRENNPGAALNGETDKIMFTPVPFTKELVAHVTLETHAVTSLAITAVDGRVMYNAWDNEPTDEGQTDKHINTSNWPAGLYFYKLVIDGKPYTGKLQKD